MSRTYSGDERKRADSTQRAAKDAQDRHRQLRDRRRRGVDKRQVKLVGGSCA